jgi:hypothetical protein
MILPVAAQDNLSPLITAANVHQLRSIATIDWSDWTPKVERGWLALSPDGKTIAVVDRAENVLILDALTGTQLKSQSVSAEDELPATFLDAAFSADGSALVSIYSEGGAYDVAYLPLDAESPLVARVVSTDVPLRVWANDYIWLEMTATDATNERYILQTDIPRSTSPDESFFAPSEWLKIPSGPEIDPDSFLRVGRIQPPLAITATQDGLIKRWNLETGEITATRQLDILPGVGQLNADRSYFAWADQKFDALHMVNFESGTDRVIAQLGGTYIPYFLLSSDADVIIGVNVDSEPKVVAWSVESGERMDLGEYRDCKRQPDMVRLSKDGTTIGIGCDAGLDIWRVVEQN